VAPTNDTIYTAVTSTLVINAQQATGTILDRLGARLAGIADGPGLAALGGPGLASLGAAGPVLGAPLQVAQAGNVGQMDALAQSLPQMAEGAWFRGIGGFASINGNASAPGYTGDSGGFLAGWDRMVLPDTYLGLAGGYTHADIDEHSTSTGAVDTARVNVYGGTLWGASLLTATAGYAHDWIGTERPVAMIGVASESHGGDEASAAAQWALPIHLDALTITPKAGLQFLHLSEGGFAETGADGFDLSSGSRDTNSLQPYVGVAAAQSFVTADGTQITPEVRLGYSREVLSNNRLLTVAATDGTPFLVQGVKPSRDMVTPGVGLTVQAQQNLYLYANYDALVHTGNTTDQTLSAGLRVRF
jgi:outer membrane autotransporter protein